MRNGGGGGGGGGGSNSNTGSGKSGGLMDGTIAAGITKFATLALHERVSGRDRDHKRNHSLSHVGSKSSERLLQGGGGSSGSGTKGRSDPAKLLGTPPCPRMDEIPLLEPLVCKKIAHERLTVLVFLEDSIVTGCQEGFICTWARPGKVVR